MGRNELADLINKSFQVLTPKGKINNFGYAEIDICEFEILKNLKKHTIKYNLPCMERKWNKIDENKIGFYEKSRERIKKCYSLNKKGYKNKDIAKELGMSRGRVSFILSKIKNGKYTFKNKFAPIELESEVPYEVY